MSYYTICCKEGSGGVLTAPVGSFPLQLHFLDFDSWPCPGPLLSMMPSFMLLDLEIAKNSESSLFERQGNVYLKCHYYNLL